MNLMPRYTTPTHYLRRESEGGTDDDSESGLPPEKSRCASRPHAHGHTGERECNRTRKDRIPPSRLVRQLVSFPFFGVAAGSNKRNYICLSDDGIGGSIYFLQKKRDEIGALISKVLQASRPSCR